MKIPVILLDLSGEVESPDTQWDMALIKDIIDDKVWQPAQGYEFIYDPQVRMIDEDLSKFGAVVIVPGRQNAGFEKGINGALSVMKWCLLIVTGDEERSFDLSKIKHPNMKVWLMHPTLKDKADFYIGSGYAPHLRENLAQAYQEYLDKPLDWYFAGQNNHPRRHEATTILEKMISREDIKGSLNTSEGFTQGQIPAIYALNMAKTKAAPCPSGIQSPDSFRVYEALEAGAVPVADDLSSVLVHKTGYWQKAFNDYCIPFKIYDKIENLEGYICDVVREYPAFNNRVYAWWQQYKRFMVYTLNEHIHEISGLDYPTNEIRNKITVLIVTSPIKAHPDTTIIENTIRDIRAKLPDCEIIIGIDGVRAEQEEYRERYEEYQKRLLWKCNFEWSNVLPIRFEKHLHQAVMTKHLLSLVKTPIILFVEHDTSLTPDYDFDWLKLVEAIESGQSYMIRFNHEAHILHEHEHMMLGEEEVCGIPMIKTIQWSQRPHLASTAFYKDIIERYFTDESRTMIEDVIHGKLISAYEDDGIQGWYRWRVWVYAKDDNHDGNIKRSYTTDGRGEDPKYEMRF